nr:alpha/beta hydrolase [Streptococcus uberis]
MLSWQRSVGFLLQTPTSPSGSFSTHPHRHTRAWTIKPLKEKLTFAAIATEVKELLDSLDLEDYVLVGHSDGANLAIAFENVYPQNVTGMLLNA